MAADKTTALEVEAILDNAGVAIVFTRDRQVYRCNRSAAELFGWTTEALVGQSGAVFYPSDAAYAALGARAGPILARGDILDTEQLMARRDGSTFLAHLVARAIDPTHPEHGTIWTASDISEQRRQRELNRRLLREHELIFEQAHVGILITQARTILRCNRRAEELLGFAPGELIGHSTRVYFPDDASWQAVGEQAYAALARTGNYISEHRFVRKDGAEILCKITGSPLDPEAPASGQVWLLDDVTEERRLRSARDALLREHTLIFERAPTGIMFVRERTILRCNPRLEAIFGYPAGTLAGQSSRILFASEADWVSTGQAVYAAVRQDGLFEGDIHYRRRDRSPLVCHATGRMVDASDPDAGFVWQLEDITARRQAEAALAQHHREQRLIFDNAMIGISYMRNRTFLRCNRRLEEIFGFPPGALEGQSSKVLFAHEADWEAAGKQVYPDAASNTFEGVLQYVRQDGAPIWVRTIGRTVKGADGVPTWIWVYEDVTASRQRELELQQAHQDYALIFDNALIGISYVRDRVFLRCNRRVEEIFGYGPGELVGQSSRVLFQDEAEWLAVGQHVYGQTPAGGVFNEEIRYRRKDGTPVWVQASGKRIVLGGEETWVWTHEDVTRRREAEEALRINNQFLEQRVRERTQELSRQVSLLEELIEAIPGPVYYKDREGRYLGSNAVNAAWLGIRREELLGRTVREFLGDAAELHETVDRELLEHPGSRVYEFELKVAGLPPRQAVMHKATFSRHDGRVGGIIAVMIDITERKRMEDRLRQAATVFENTAEGVTITAPDGTIVAVNRAFTEITGYPEDEVIGKNPRLLHSGRQSPAFYRQMWDALGAQGRWQGEIWNRHKDGRVYPEWLTISAVRDQDGRLSNYVGVFSDITAIKAAQAQLDYQAHHDPLTGLPNRLLLDDRLRGALVRARREQTMMALLFIDLDRFKNINDTLGHHIGDRVLCQVAQRFHGLIREADTVARLGGDEFLIVLEGIADAADASRIADKILTDLRDCPVTVDQEFFIGASIGLSLFPQDGDDATTLMKHADIAMYRAKERGRNTYEFFTADLTRFSLERFQLESGLRRAIERGELRIHLQPQFALPLGRLIGAEALVRWQHPQLGLIPPGKFIPLAEESGLIVALGEWLQRTACRQWARWLAAGADPGVLAINASGVEFRRGNLVENLAETLHQTALAADRLEIEITESAIMSHAEQSVELLRRLRELGVGLAIDDFGTGYSSLSYLKRLPLTRLKIDQSFVRGLPHDADDSAITQAVLALGHSLRLKVIAEGVETEAQLAYLMDAGCDEFQGFLRGKPVPMDEFAARYLNLPGAASRPH